MTVANQVVTRLLRGVLLLHLPSVPQVAWLELLRAGRRVGLTYPLGPVLSVRDPAGENDTTTTVGALCPRALLAWRCSFSLWVLGLGVFLRGPSMAQTEPARGRASLLRAFGQVTPVLLQLCQLARPPAPVPESQGEGGTRGSRSARPGGQRASQRAEDDDL